VGLSTVVVFLSLVFWAWVLGPLGAVLAVPLTLLVKALLIDGDPRAAWMSGLLGGGPIAVPDVPASAQPGAGAPAQRTVPRSLSTLLGGLVVIIQAFPSAGTVRCLRPRRVRR
jgi:hypothetical protein